MKMLICILLFFLTGCACINYSDQDVTASYCSTKDIKNVKIKVGQLEISAAESNNEAKEALKDITKGAVQGVTGQAPSPVKDKAKELIRQKVLERLSE